MTWDEERKQIEAAAIEAIRAGERMRDVAARAGYSISTIRTWAQRRGVLRQPQIKTTYIYALKSPLDHLIYYIGKANDPKRRLYAHLKTATNSYMQEWFASLDAAGQSPELIILGRINTNLAKWRTVELQFITKYARLGHPLRNIEVAGWSGVAMSSLEKARAARWPKKKAKK